MSRKTAVKSTAGPKSQLSTAAKSLQIPAGCHKCQCAKFEPINGGRSKTREIYGRVHGFDFATVTWETKQCAKCGQAIAIRTYYAAAV